MGYEALYSMTHLKLVMRGEEANSWAGKTHFVPFVFENLIPTGNERPSW
jgi:hypothetical protein